MDLSDKTPEQPRSTLENARTMLDRPPSAPRAVEQARGDDPTGLPWTRDAVDAALAPFVALSKAVPGNRRKAHVYRPRLMGHRVAAYAARAAVEIWSCRTALGGLNPCRSISQVAL